MATIKTPEISVSLLRWGRCSPIRRRCRREMIGGRLQAISRGEAIPTAVHPELAREEMVLNIDQFSLWYGTKQALRTITLGYPQQDHGPHRPVRLR